MKAWEAERNFYVCPECGGKLAIREDQKRRAETVGGDTE